MRPTDIPFLTLTIRSENKCALACSYEYPNPSHATPPWWYAQFSASHYTQSLRKYFCPEKIRAVKTELAPKLRCRPCPCADRTPRYNVQRRLAFPNRDDEAPH